MLYKDNIKYFLVRFEIIKKISLWQIIAGLYAGKNLIINNAKKKSEFSFRNLKIQPIFANFYKNIIKCFTAVILFKLWNQKLYPLWLYTQKKT